MEDIVRKINKMLKEEENHPKQDLLVIATLALLATPKTANDSMMAIKEILSDYV